MTFERVCESCIKVLTRAYVGVTQSLFNGHEEERERKLVSLYERLTLEGLLPMYDVEPVAHPPYTQLRRRRV